MTRPVILCVATSGYALIWAECIGSHRAYARAHGLDYVLIDRDPPAARHPKWLKFELAAQKLGDGCDVMLIDADARILPAAPSFAAVLAAHPAADIFAAHGVSGRPNSGIVFFRGGSASVARPFLERCLENAATPVPLEDKVTDEGENGHFIHYLKQAPFLERFHRLEEGWNRTTAAVMPDDFVHHYTGSFRERYLASLPHLDFSALEDGEHPLIRPVPELAGAPRREFVTLLRAHADPALLRRLAEQEEQRAGLRPPPVLSQAPVSLLWRIERATGWLERPTRLLLQRLLRPGATALDIGAHIGYFTDLMAEGVGPTGRVIAFESHPANLALLRRACGTRAEVFQRALGSRRAPAILHFGSGHSNHSLAKTRASQESGVEIQVTTIDHVAKNLRLSDIALIKCDAEGMELEILKRAAETLRRMDDISLIVEINPKQLAHFGANAGQIVEELARHEILLRRINDSYSLGPVGKVVGRRTENYLAMRPHRWAALEQALAAAR